MRLLHQPWHPKTTSMGMDLFYKLLRVIDVQKPANN